MTHRYNFVVHPVADPRAVVGGKGCKYRFTVLDDGLLRYEWAPNGEFEDRASTFAVHRKQPVPAFRVVDQFDRLEIFTDRMHVTHNKSGFNRSGLTVYVTRKDSQLGTLWRYGQDCGDLRGTARTLDGANGRIALEPGVISRTGFSTLDDSKSMLFDRGGWAGARQPGDDRVDGYLFAYGNDYRAAMKAFYAIAGVQPLLPRWSLGNWWSRYHAYSANEYLELMDRFKVEGLPFCVGVLDMDWHLVRDKRVIGSGWTGYTWNRDLFPDPESFLSELHKRRLKVTLNDHPADGVRSWEDQYKDMAKALGRDTKLGDPIPFDIVDRSFCDAFFDILHRSLEEQGVDFWWIDWQQGSYTRTPGMDPLWMLNHYSYLDNSRDGNRPLNFSRYAGPGSHRYPIGFSGDTIVTWESLEFQPEFTATASNIGFGWWSHDIGGHTGGYKSEELETRWYQLGVFSPIMRLHSTANPFIKKEPWTFGVEAREIITKFLRLRHKLLPYLYSMNVRAAQDSIPIVQPLYWHYPTIDAAYRNKNQYLFGSELLVNPITSPMDSESRLSRVRCWIPPGRHVDIFSSAVYDGDRELWLNRDLSQYPVLAKEGAIIPIDASQIPENGGDLPQTLHVLVVVGADGKFEIIEDDGSGSSLETTKITGFEISYKQSTGILKICPIKSKNPPLLEQREWVIEFVACKLPILELAVLVNGKPHKYSTSKGFALYSTTIDLGSIPSESVTTVQVGKDPQVVPTNALERVYAVLQDSWIDYDFKVELWKFLSADTPLSIKIGQLSSKGMNEPVFNAILEWLVADKRSFQK